MGRAGLEPPTAALSPFYKFEEEGWGNERLVEEEEENPSNFISRPVTWPVEGGA
jgi:hypothetical protein